MSRSNKLQVDIKWGTRQRLEYIELMAFYTGIVTRSDVVKAFGISDAAATKDLKLYNDTIKGNLIYKQSVFGFVPSESFTEQFANLSPETALPIIAANLATMSGPYGTEPIFGITAELLPIPSRFPDKAVVAQITCAIKQQKKLRATYHSLTDRDSNEQRILEPHALVNTGLRWHVRAFNEETYDFRDFVLSRFSTAEMLDEPAESSQAYDDDWVEFITLKLEPHPKLNEQKRANLLIDYGSKDGSISLKTRRAFIGYMLHKLTIDTTTDHSKDPDVYQLVLGNRNEIEPFAGWAFLK